MFKDVASKLMLRYPIHLLDNTFSIAVIAVIYIFSVSFYYYVICIYLIAIQRFCYLVQFFDAFLGILNRIHKNLFFTFSCKDSLSGTERRGGISN